MAHAKIFQGWGLIAAGRVEGGITELREGLVAWRRTGSRFHGPYRLARVADGLLLAGATDEAREVLAEATAVAHETDSHWSDAELDRLSGVAALQASGGAFEPTHAETYLRRAVDAARRGNFRWTELQAATSLARLWNRQGRRIEARDLLAPVYNWFREGRDTRDLKDAEMLLKELL